MGSTHKTIYMPDIEAIRCRSRRSRSRTRVVDELWTRSSRPIDAHSSADQRQIDLLREHRQALITAAVTGELDIAEAQREARDERAFEDAIEASLLEHGGYAKGESARDFDRGSASTRPSCSPSSRRRRRRRGEQLVGSARR